MAGKKGRSGRPRTNVLYLRSKNLAKADEIINRFLEDESIPDKEKLEVASKIVIKDMGIQANKDNAKLLTQNNFFTQIISEAAKEVKKVSNQTQSQISSQSAKAIEAEYYVKDETK